MDTVESRMTSAQRWVLGLASLASFMISLDSLVVTTALSTIQRELHASLASLEWTVNAYSLSFAVLLLTGAALGDRFGRRRMFAIGLMLFVLASAACAMSYDVGSLVTARAVQGAGAALAMPLALTLVSAAFPPERRGKALGILAGLNGLAVFAGPVVGGAVAEGLAWQWIFWINVPIGVIAAALVVARLAESTGPSARFDLVGMVLVAGGSFGLVWALIRANEVGWASPEVVATLAGGLLLGGAFVGWEARTAAPMLPMRFFRIRAFVTANVANFCLYASLFGALFLMTQYLQVALHHGPLAAGLRMLAWTATLMVCGPIAGNLVDRFGERRFMVVGLLLNAVGMGWLAVIVAPDLAFADLVIPLVVSGCGLSMAMPAVQKSAVGAVKLTEIGQASGAFTMLRILGGVFGIAVLTAVFAGSGGFASPQDFSDGFSAAMAVAAGISFLGALAGLGMPGRPAPTDPVGTASRTTGKVTSR